MEPAILYVDDESANLDLFRRSFDEEFCLVTAGSGPAALELLETREDIGVLVSDQRMDPMTGIELVTRAAVRWPVVTRVLLTAYSDRDLLLQAIRLGKVHDYVLKPWSAEDLGLRLRAALDAFKRHSAQAHAEAERDVLRDQLRELEPSRNLVGLEEGLAPMSALLNRVAPTESTVMIRGESGTGKELVAREVHRRSLRTERPFIRVNCAAFSEGVLESELFGHEAGAFTGAKQARLGRFEQASEGTLFLDEIGDGRGAAARFRELDFLTADGEGNLYVSDTGAIRKFVIATGEVTTLAKPSARAGRACGSISSHPSRECCSRRRSTFASPDPSATAAPRSVHRFPCIFCGDGAPPAD
jgi:DNA-binding NtrC family response regulator